MRKCKYICTDCKKIFDVSHFCFERHGLDSEPYERVAVCPVCRGSNFLNFETHIEKIEIAEKLLPAIASLNRYINAVKDIFGFDVKNRDLSDGVNIIVELIGELFDFIHIGSFEKKLFAMTSDKECEAILSYLKGDL